MIDRAKEKAVVDAYHAEEARRGGLAHADPDEVAEAVAQEHGLSSKQVKSVMIDHLIGPMRAG